MEVAGGITEEMVAGERELLEKETTAERVAGEITGEQVERTTGVRVVRATRNKCRGMLPSPLPYIIKSVNIIIQHNMLNNYVNIIVPITQEQFFLVLPFI